jgi:hypothetical protein
MVSTLSHASLINRGGGLIYDDVLNITWLQDTNYAMNDVDASDAASDGKMEWQQANDWAAGLSYYDAVRDVTYDDWRLPTLSPIDGISFNTMISNDGSTDQGYARTTTDGSDGGWRDSSGTPVSELGYMFYVNLANLGKCDPGRNDQCNIQDGWNQGNNFNTGLFTNFSQFNVDTSTGTVGSYATGTDFDDTLAWNFGMITGEQALKRKGSGFDRLAAWAVRDGDVALSAIPVPASIWLFCSGLLGLMGLAKRKKWLNSSDVITTP